jgi:hypothetical protein
VIFLKISCFEKICNHYFTLDRLLTDSREYRIQESDLKSDRIKIKSEGTRFTVLHAGCHLGFAEGCGFLLN